jgi:hypothetical protein
MAPRPLSLALALSLSLSLSLSRARALAPPGGCFRGCKNTKHDGLPLACCKSSATDLWKKRTTTWFCLSPPGGGAPERRSFLRKRKKEKKETGTTRPSLPPSLSLSLLLPAAVVGRAHRVQVEQQRVGVQEHAVGAGRDRARDLARRLDAPERQESGVAGEGLADQARRLGLTLFFCCGC